MGDNNLERPGAGIEENATSDGPPRHAKTGGWGYRTEPVFTPRMLSEP